MKIKKPCTANQAKIIKQAHDITALEEQCKRYRQAYDEACKTVAEMHAAALGQVQGPVSGVVKDVENLRHERDDLRYALGSPQLGARAQEILTKGPQARASSGLGEHYMKILCDEIQAQRAVIYSLQHKMH